MLKTGKILLVSSLFSSAAFAVDTIPTKVRCTGTTWDAKYQVVLNIDLAKETLRGSADILVIEANDLSKAKRLVVEGLGDSGQDIMSLSDRGQTFWYQVASNGRNEKPNRVGQYEAGFYGDVLEDLLGDSFSDDGDNTLGLLCAELEPVPAKESL